MSVLPKRGLRETEGGNTPGRAASPSLNEPTTPSAKEGKSSAPNGGKEEIPLPGVRILREYEQDTTADFVIPESYVSYVPPVCFSNDMHFERQRIEYEFDEEDARFLQEHHIAETELDEEAMEILIDVLEKESFRTLEFRQINAALEEPEINDDEDDMPCSACDDRDWDDDNPILFCDGCDMAIHRHCQDLEDIPAGDWFCDLCVHRMSQTASKTTKQGFDKLKSPSPTSSSKSRGASKKPFIDDSILVPCVLCGMVDGGPMKRTQLKDKLVHIACALMTPEVWFEHGVANVSKALTARKGIPCQVCQVPGGVVKCVQRGCNTNCHVMCARENGQQLSYNVPDPEDEDVDIDTGMEAQSDAISDKQSGLDDSFVTIDSDGGNLSAANDTVGAAMQLDLKVSSDGVPGEKKKKRKRKAVVKKEKTHIPFQMLCAAHSGVIRAKKLEEARKQSLKIPVEVGRFLTEEDDESAVGDTTIYSKALDIIKKGHSKQLVLKQNIFDLVVDYWRKKRAAKKNGHMPFIFQLHVLVSHFKEDFDAGRRMTSHPRQVEITLAQYTPQQKFKILNELREGIESLRTLMDCIKQREVKKKMAVVERLNLFNAIFNSQNPKEALLQVFPKRGSNATLFPFPVTPGGSIAPQVPTPPSAPSTPVAGSTIPPGPLTQSSTRGPGALNRARATAASTRNVSNPPRRKKKLEEADFASIPTEIPTSAELPSALQAGSSENNAMILSPSTPSFTSLSERPGPANPFTLYARQPIIPSDYSIHPFGFDFVERETNPATTQLDMPLPLPMEVDAPAIPPPQPAMPTENLIFEPFYNKFNGMPPSSYPPPPMNGPQL